jgi:hypothetical protein
MRPISNYDSVQATDGEFKRPGNGGYILEIVDVKDVPLDPMTQKGDYLKISYDICYGDFKGYYSKQNERFGGDWFANFIRSYKEKALGMFKHFTNCVEASNNGYKWNWNERSLVHKIFGAVLQEEEYQKSDGSVGVRLTVKEVKTAKQIMEGDFKVPQTKKLERTENSGYSQPNYAVVNVDGLDDDLPFI